MEVIENLIRQTAFFQDGIDWRNYVMILVAFIFLYLAIKKGYEPLLLLPIAFGMLLANIYPLIIQDGGLLNYFFKLDEWSILPSLIFLGVGAMTDFGPLIANPKSFLLGAAAQFGIFAAYILALLWGFNGGEAAAVSIIGGGIFLYVTGSDYSAAYHETFDNEKGKRNQDGAAPSGIQTGENPLPNYRYGYCMSDSSKYRTTCWYAYAW